MIDCVKMLNDYDEEISENLNFVNSHVINFRCKQASGSTVILCFFRYKRFEKAFMLAVDVGAADLFMVCIQNRPIPFIFTPRCVVDTPFSPFRRTFISLHWMLEKWLWLKMPKIKHLKLTVSFCQQVMDLSSPLYPILSFPNIRCNFLH